jgi:hypothetical protein
LTTTLKGYSIFITLTLKGDLNMPRNQAKKSQGPAASLSQAWKKAIQKNTRKKSRQMATLYIKNL